MLPIVIVDDSREDVALVQRVLIQCRILNPVATFLSGKECIDFIEATGDFKHRVAPFLMLLDLAMQPISGIDVLRKFQEAAKSSPDLQRSLVVMLSGVSDLALVNEGYRLGASTFVTKPLEMQEMMQLAKWAKKLRLDVLPEGN